MVWCSIEIYMILTLRTSPKQVKMLNSMSVLIISGFRLLTKMTGE